MVKLDKIYTREVIKAKLLLAMERVYKNSIRIDAFGQLMKLIQF